MISASFFGKASLAALTAIACVACMFTQNMLAEFGLYVFGMITFGVWQRLSGFEEGWYGAQQAKADGSRPKGHG